MTDVYNLTNITNSVNMFELTRGVNQLTSGLFASFVLLAVWLVLLSAFFSNFGLKRAMLSSSFIVSLLASLVFFMGLISMTTLILPILLLLISLILVVWN